MLAELREILTPAYRCPSFDEVCRSRCTWSPEDGHIPRGYGGATGSVQDVELVIVTAEPGDPADTETYAGMGPNAMMDAASGLFARALEHDVIRRSGRAAPYHRNLRTLLGYFWPGDSIEQVLRKTWLTNAVLCSASASGAAVDRAVETECAKRYLVDQLNLFPHAFVTTLGDKARQRLKRQNLGDRVGAHAHHPSARNLKRAKGTWRQAAAQFHRHQEETGQ